MTVEHNVIDQLASSRPGSLDSVDDATANRVLSVVLSRMDAVGTKRAPHRIRQLRWAAIAVATGAVAALLGGLLVQGGPAQTAAPPRPMAVGQSATAVLTSAAARLDSAPVPAPGRYFYTKILVAMPGSSGTEGLQTERWTAAASNDASWSSGQIFPDGQVQLSKDDPGDWGQRRFFVEGRALTLEDIRSLPTTPAALEAFLLAPYPPSYAVTHPVDLVERLFGEAFDLAAAPAAPEVRAEVFRLLATLPGVTDLGPVTDALHRIGIGIAITSGNVQHQLIIDPTTGAVLDMRDITVTHGGSQITLDNLLVQSGWTNSVTP
jgi:hypothetical protein